MERDSILIQRSLRSRISFNQSRFEGMENSQAQRWLSIMIKGSVLQEAITTLWCVCAWKQSSKLVKQKQNCKEKDTHYHSWRFIHPSILNGEIQQAEISTDITEFSNTIDKTDVINIYRQASSSNSRMNTISSSRGGYTKTDHIMGHKACSGKFKIAEIIWSLF